VISRTSSFAFKGKAVDIREAARELGVRYVLEGSVRRAGPRLRVTAQLVDAETGAHLWAEKFEGATEDIFAFQDAITESVIGLVEPTIRKAEIERARRKAPSSLAAYDLFLKALPFVYSMEVDDYAEALRLLEQAIALDSNFAVAIGYAAWTAEKLGARTAPFASDATHARALELSYLAIDRGRDDPFVALLAGWVLLAVANDPLGIEMVRRGLTANPNNLVALNLGGVTNLSAGDLDASAECYARAYRLSPRAPDAFWSLTGLGWVELQRGNDAASLSWFERSLATGNEWAFTLLGVVAALALSGETQRAKESLARLNQIAPQWSRSDLMRGPGGIGWERLREGLRIALSFES
jgi:tetratricopeptide (TPR) repeat protein